MKKILEENYAFALLSLYILMVTLLPKANTTAWLLFILMPALIGVKKNGYKKTGFELPFFLLILAVLISFIGTPMEYIKIGLKELEKPIKFLSLILLIPQMFSNYKELDKKYLKYIFTGISLIYLVLVYFGSKGIFLIYDYKVNLRLTGGYQVSSYSGILMVMNLYYFRDIFCSKKYLEKIIFLTTIILLILTNSRGAWLGALCGYSLYILLEQRKNIFKVLIILVLIAVGTWNMKIPSVVKFKDRVVSIGNIRTNASNLGRIYMWKQGISIIKDNPINGIGYRTAGRDVIDFFNPKIGIVHFHNMIVDTFAGAGILGVLSYFYIYFYNIEIVRKLRKSFGNEVYRFLYPMIGVFVYDNFEPIWIRGYVYNVLFALLGIMYLYVLLKKGDEK